MELFPQRFILGAAALLAMGFLFNEGGVGRLPSPGNNGPQIAMPTDTNLLEQPMTPTAEQSKTYREMDLLRRDGFSAAQAATVSLHVADKRGVVPLGLNETAFTLMVNGTVRGVRVQAPGGATLSAVPIVLLVFPPNDTVLHSIGVRESKKYFGGLPEEVLPWKVGIFDSNGSLTPFTNGRSQLLANLDLIDHTIEPVQYASSAGLPSRFRWEGSWLTKAEDAIALMQRFDGPKVILAMNPLSESIYGLNDRLLAHDGPAALEGMTLAIGGHIYVANVGGPDVIVPGGEAAQQSVAQGGNLYARRNINRQLNAAFAAAAYRTSIMMETAQDTLGGFSNSLSTLAGYIHRDLDENYLLTFDMTPADRDKGTPKVEVELVDRRQAVRIVDVAAVGTIYDSDRKLLSKEVRLYPAEKLRKNAPESWAATFILRSEGGAIEMRQETKFVADGGSGYLGFVEVPLEGPGIKAGPHTLEVNLRGPGINGELKQSRKMMIAAVAH